jgi:hypothetical protein
MHFLGLRVLSQFIMSHNFNPRSCAVYAIFIGEAFANQIEKVTFQSALGHNSMTKGQPARM